MCQGEANPVTRRPPSSGPRVPHSGRGAGGEAGAPGTGQLIRHPGRTKVSVPASSPVLAPWFPGGLRAALRREAGQLCGGRGRKRGYLRLETGGIPLRGRAPAWPARSSGPRPAAPGPLRWQHHPAGRGRDVTLHPRRPRPGPRSASLKRHRPAAARKARPPPPSPADDWGGGGRGGGAPGPP